MKLRLNATPEPAATAAPAKPVHREVLHLAHPLQAVRPLSPGEAERLARFEEQLKTRYEDGLRDGEKGLREQLLQQRTEIVELQKGVLQSLEKALPQVRTECEAALVELALEVARKVVAGIPIKPAMIEGAIREALDSLEEAHDVCVLVNEEDLQLLQKYKSPVLKTNAGDEKVRFQASAEVSRGGCMVQTRFGVVDARVETKFEQVKKSLRT